MPPPQIPPEAFFAAVIKPADLSNNYRYLVFEWTETDSSGNPIGVLCEWFADKSRSNHRLLGPANIETFKELISAQLHKEELSRNLGITTKFNTWNPSNKEKYEESLDPSGTYRIQHCVFAFETIPRAAQHSAKDWVSAIIRGDGQRVLEELWQQSGRFCVERGAAPDILPSPGLSAELINVFNNRFILITMPTPVFAPEPYFVAVQAEVEKNQADNISQVLTCELAEGGWNVPCQIGSVSPVGAHSILGSALEPTRESFIECINDVLSQKPLRNSGTNLLRHLRLYMDIYAHLGNSSDI